MRSDPARKRQFPAKALVGKCRLSTSVYFTCYSAVPGSACCLTSNIGTVNPLSVRDFDLTAWKFHQDEDLKSPAKGKKSGVPVNLDICKVVDCLCVVRQASRPSLTRRTISLITPFRACPALTPHSSISRKIPSRCRCNYAPTRLVRWCRRV